MKIDPIWKLIERVLEEWSEDCPLTWADNAKALLEMALVELKPATTPEVGSPVYWLPFSGVAPKKREWRVFMGTRECAIYRCDLDPLAVAYHGVGIQEELEKIKTWLLANPTRRKTVNGIPRFLNSWMARAQDRPRPQDSMYRAKRFARLSEEDWEGAVRDQEEEESALGEYRDALIGAEKEFGDESAEYNEALRALMEATENFRRFGVR